MKTEFILNIISIVALFGVGFYLGKKYERCDKPKINKKPPLWLHCFECEIEMPVKVKNGQLYCSNCGLKHR